MATIGFLGLGSMGAAIAGRLQAAGHDLVVWNRSAGADDELVAAGARRATVPAEALAAEVSFSMLAHDAAADAVLTEANFASGTGLHVNMASLSGEATDRLAARAASAGRGYLAAPVLGRPNVAAAGKLNVIVGGDSALLDEVRPLIETFSARIWPAGAEPRMASIAKIAVNYDIIHALKAIGESSALVEAHGIDASWFVELLTNTLFPGVVYSGYGDMIANRRYTPAGFTTTLGLKDLSLAEAGAAEGGITLASAPVLREAFESAIADPTLGPDADWAAIGDQGRP